MASTSGHAAVVNLQEALGYNGLPLARFNAPASLLQNPIYRKSLLSLVGRSRRALDAGERESVWEPRQEFLQLMHEGNGDSLLNTLSWAAEVCYRTNGIRAEDVELLLKLVSFLEEYLRVPQLLSTNVRIDINLRQKARQNQERWGEYNRSLRQHEKDCFSQRVKPLLEVKGYAPEDVTDLLEVEWEEFCSKREKARDKYFEQTGNPSFPPWPKGRLTFEERAFGHTLALGLEAGHGNNWQLLSQLTSPTFPNELSKEEYVRLAVIELLEDANQREQTEVYIPRLGELTRAEKAELRLLRTRILDGRELRWAEFRSRKGEQYPNQLTSVQLLALAAGLPSTRFRVRDADTGRQPSAAGYPLREFDIGLALREPDDPLLLLLERHQIPIARFIAPRRPEPAGGERTRGEGPAGRAEQDFGPPSLGRDRFERRTGTQSARHSVPSVGMKNGRHGPTSDKEKSARATASARSARRARSGIHVEAEGAAAPVHPRQKPQPGRNTGAGSTEKDSANGSTDGAAAAAVRGTRPRCEDAGRELSQKKQAKIDADIWEFYRKQRTEGEKMMAKSGTSFGSGNRNRGPGNRNDRNDRNERGRNQGRRGRDRDRSRSRTPSAERRRRNDR
ncbi:hypothetical protein KFL_002510170 [Klebsormidium nitens]|uniref:Uncharacterized protein n=1 Tax=Klebsormidium nitens TaxID=105231 RepID=A0A1Y1I485_KLENI|nr:hypothetical protein KFL_002510170 [Klebsormidium nitens]|eukprot:GAQ85740.1 hypothetical protein KFL_002510170 [Klebsormidium nitens]